MGDGFRTLVCDLRITSLITNGVLTQLFLFPFAFVAFPFIIIKVLGGVELDYGIVQSVATIGSVLAIVVVGWAKNRYNTAQCIGIGILGMLAFTVLLLPLSSYSILNLLHGNSFFIVPVFSAIIFIFYLSFGFYVVFYVTFYQTIVPQEKLGRYVAIQALLFALSRLIGLKLFGYLFDNFELIVPILILLVGMILKLVVHIPFMKETKRLEENVKLAMIRSSTNEPGIGR